MALIGTASKTAEGDQGSIRTRTITVKAAFVLNDKSGNEKAPDLKILADGKTLGTTWQAKGNGDSGRSFLTVALGDRSFAEPIRAVVFDNLEEGKAGLVWTRTKGFRGGN